MLRRCAKLGRRCAGELLERAVELRERLKSRRKRDLTYAKMTFPQQPDRFFVAQLRDVTDEINSGGLLELLAQIIRARVCRLGDVPERNFFAAMFMDEIARLSDSHRFGTVGVNFFFVHFLEERNPESGNDLSLTWQKLAQSCSAGETQD